MARITLHRPEVFNSFRREMALSLQQYLDQCRDDASIRVVYLTGAGRAFCAGQDLQEITPDPTGQREVPAMTTILTEHYNPIIARIRALEKPVVCAVNGVAAGAGANIALACDITVATASAAFIQAFSKIGLIPDSGGTFTLPRLVGLQRATALMMLGEKVMAPEAAAMGMIYRAVADADFAAESWRIAEALAEMPPRGLALTKRALHASLTNDLTAQLSLEDELQSIAGNTADFREGVQAFVEKRKPVFKGH